MNPIDDRPQWRKSSHSGVGGCVEVHLTGDLIIVRHSKAPDDGQLVFTPVEWQAFVEGVRDGEFDLPDKPRA
jgi:hypothetical protein